jgi:hypothetical protein
MAATESYFIIDDTLCEHVGSLFEYVDRHYDHCDGSYPLAHNLVTSHYLSGAVRMPVHAQVYRRYEDITAWERFMLKHFPDQEIPTTAKERAKVHKKCDAKLLEDPDFLELHQQFRTKIEIAQTLLALAVAQGVAFTTMLMDSWYLTPALVKTLAERQIDWVSLLKRNRKLETGSFQLQDAAGTPILFPTPHVKVEDLVPLIPPQSYKKVEFEHRTRSFAAIEAHWCLVFVAYSLLHLSCLPPSIPGHGQSSTTPIQSIGAVCRQQGQALIEQLILFAHQRLQQGCAAAELFTTLFAKQHPVTISTYPALS